MKTKLLLIFALLCGAVPSFAQTVTPPPPAVVATGTQITFTVVSDGTAPLSYKWSKQAVGASTFTVIAGQTTAVYIINSATVADAGLYQVEVSNAYGKTTTPNASVDAGTPPKIVSFGVVVAPPKP